MKTDYGTVRTVLAGLDLRVRNFGKRFRGGMALHVSAHMLFSLRATTKTAARGARGAAA
jgi:hypothetical protein